jgi:hypothetical protein
MPTLTFARAAEVNQFDFESQADGVKMRVGRSIHGRMAGWMMILGWKNLCIHHWRWHALVEGAYQKPILHLEKEEVQTGTVASQEVAGGVVAVLWTVAVLWHMSEILLIVENNMENN